MIRACQTTRKSQIAENTRSQCVGNYYLRNAIQPCANDSTFVSPPDTMVRPGKRDRQCINPVSDIRAPDLVLGRRILWLRLPAPLPLATLALI